MRCDSALIRAALGASVIKVPPLPTPGAYVQVPKEFSMDNFKRQISERFFNVTPFQFIIQTKFIHSRDESGLRCSKDFKLFRL